MKLSHVRSWIWGAVVAVSAALLAGPAALPAQLGGILPSGSTSTVTGQAAVVRATLLGSTTALADTGTLSGPNDFRDAAMGVANIPSLMTAESLSSGAISWSDEVDSVASVANLSMSVGGVIISASDLVARASQSTGKPGTGSTVADNLMVNGVPVSLTGIPNQTIPIPGGQVVLNEQSFSSTGTAVVNAVHITITGVADVVLASATAGIS